MTVGFSLDAASGPRESGQPYLIDVNALDKEMPFPLEAGMASATILKYWAESDSLIGGKFIITRDSDLLWYEEITRTTFGDPLNNPAAFQIERSLASPVEFGQDVFIRTGTFAEAWLASYPQDTTVPQLNSFVVLPTQDSYRVGDTLTIQFEVSEDLLVNPLVEVNSNLATFVQLQTRTYTYTYVFQGSDLGSSFELSFTLTDLANNEAIVTHTYVKDILGPRVVYGSPVPGTYNAPLSVELLTEETSGGTIRYTVDNSDPRTYQSFVYSSPISILANTRILATYVVNDVASEIVVLEYFIQASPMIEDPSTTPTIYPVFERDIVIRGDAPASDGARVRIRVNDQEYWGSVKSGKFSTPVLAVKLGDVIGAAVEDLPAGKTVSQWVTIRPMVRSDSYVMPELQSFWGGTGSAVGPVEVYRADSVTLEFPLTYQGVPLTIPSGTVYFYVTPSRGSVSKLFEGVMYILPSGEWGVDLNGALDVPGTYWGEISIEQPNGGQITLQQFPVRVRQDVRP